MQRVLTSLVLLLCVALVGSVAVAGEQGECPIAAAMSKLPQISYQVGEETTHCAQTAAKLAEEAGVEIKYVVADESYCCEQKAQVALVEATEEFVNAFTTPAVCEKSGTTTIAGQKVCCSVAAGQVASLVKEAMDHVEVSYKVGEETCNCPNKAKALADEAGVEAIFVVDGQETCCSMTHRLNVARAKYRAAVEAIANADKAKAEVKKS